MENGSADQSLDFYLEFLNGYSFRAAVNAMLMVREFVELLIDSKTSMFHQHTDDDALTVRFTILQRSRLTAYYCIDSRQLQVFDSKSFLDAVKSCKKLGNIVLFKYGKLPHSFVKIANGASSEDVMPISPPDPPTRSQTTIMPLDHLALERYYVTTLPLAEFCKGCAPLAQSGAQFVTLQVYYDGVKMDATPPRGPPHSPKFGRCMDSQRRLDNFRVPISIIKALAKSSNMATPGVVIFYVEDDNQTIHIVIPVGVYAEFSYTVRDLKRITP